MFKKHEENKISCDTICEPQTDLNSTEEQTLNMVSDLSIAGKELKEKVREFQDLKQDHFQETKKKQMDEFQLQLEEKRLQLGRRIRQLKFSFSKLKNYPELKNSQDDLFKEIHELFYIQDETNNFYEQMFVYFIGEHNDSKNTIMNLFDEIEAKIQKIQDEKEFFKTQFLSSRMVQSEQKLLPNDQEQILSHKEAEIQNKLMLKENQQMKAIIDHKELIIKNLKKKVAHKNLYQYENQLDQLEEKVKYISLFASFKNKEKIFQDRIEKIKQEIKNNVKVDLAENLSQQLNQLKYSSILTKFKEQRPEKRSKLYAEQNIEIQNLRKRVEIDIKKISKKKQQLKQLHKKIKQNDGLLLNFSSEIKMLKTLLNQMNDVSRVYKMIEEVKKKEQEVIKENEKLNQQVEKLKKSINAHQKDLGNYYVKNLQSIKKLNSFSRVHLSKTSKIKKYLQRKMQDIQDNCLFQLIDQGQTQDIHEHYKNLKFIHHCLHKQVISDIGLPKLIQKRKKIKKKNQTQKFNDDFKKKIDELKKSADKEIRQLREMVGQKDETMKRISTVISQISDIKTQLDVGLDEQQNLSQNVFEQREQIKSLNTDIQQKQQILAQFEQDLQKEIESNQNKSIEVQKLKEKIQNQKKFLKEIQKQKDKAQKQIKENEELLQEKKQKIKEIKGHLEQLKQINQELKQNLNLQYQKIQKLIEESKNKFVLLEDLTKKDKIFHQLFDIQDKKIQTKDKKIQSIEQKLINQKNLIEALLKDKIEGNKGLSDQLSKNLPSQLKKEEKQIQKLQKEFSKAVQEVSALKKKLEILKNKNRNLRINQVKVAVTQSKVKSKSNNKTKKNKKVQEMESVKNNNKNYAKKLSMKKSFTGKSNLNSNDLNNKNLQQNETLKNINKISSRKSIQESCLTLSLDNNEEDSIIITDQKSKIDKSSQVNFEKKDPKVQEYYIKKIEQFNILLKKYTDETQIKLEKLREKINKAQVLSKILSQKKELLDQQSKLQNNFNIKDMELLMNQQNIKDQSQTYQLKEQILSIFKNQENTNVIPEIFNLLNNYNIQRKDEKQNELSHELKEQSFKNLNEKQEQNIQQKIEQNIKGIQSQEDQSEYSANEDEDDERYKSLQRQLKNSLQPENKILKEKKADVFSFSNKIKKEQSIHDPNSKNLFLDDTMNQSSMNQSRQKMDKKELEKIEENSELFNKDEDDSEDFEFLGGGGKKDEIQVYDQSISESKIEDSINIEKEKKNELKEINNKTIAEELLANFDNGNMFSFKKYGDTKLDLKEKLKVFYPKSSQDVSYFATRYYLKYFLQFSIINIWKRYQLIFF